MASATILYDAVIYLEEEKLLFLIETADALDEIGAKAQADAIREITSSFQRIRRTYETL